MRFIVLLCLLALPAQAQELPDLFDVASQDALNVRATPDGDAQIVGTLAHDKQNVEIVRLDESRKWGLVNADGETSVYGEASGWVAFADMTPVYPDAHFATDFARPLWCVGVEPFWRLRVNPDGFVTTDLLEGVLTPTFASRVANRGRFRQAMVATSQAGRVTVTLRQTECGDGISDEVFGFAMEMLIEQGDDARFVTGCCSLAAPG